MTEIPSNLFISQETLVRVKSFRDTPYVDWEKVVEDFESISYQVRVDFVRNEVGSLIAQDYIDAVMVPIWKEHIKRIITSEDNEP